MAHHPWFEFERLTHDLAWPPLAGLRALEAAGVRVSREGWQVLGLDVRMALAKAGAAESVDARHVRELVSAIPPREIALRQPAGEPAVGDVPGAVVAALRLTGQPASQFWQALGALDRYVLGKLAHNTRLLLQAITEMAVRTKQWEFAVSPKKWTGMVAHSEVKLPIEHVAMLESPEFLDGRAFLLARVAGIRAARSACDLLDMHRDRVTGSIEIGYAVEHEPSGGRVVWQAHVSAADGGFFPAASLLAVTTASVALHDMVLTELGATSTIERGRLANEPWCVGWADGDATVAAK